MSGEIRDPCERRVAMSHCLLGVLDDALPSGRTRISEMGGT